MNVKQSKRLVRETLFLSLSMLIVKVLSIIYRIPYQNMVGDEGFYTYQTVYPIYGIFYNIINFSLPAAFATLLVRTKHNRFLFSQVNTAAIICTLLGSVLFFPLLFFGAPVIANKMGDPMLASSIKVISFMIIFIPLTAPLRGYFQAQNIILPNVISLTVEQFIRVGAILILSYIFINQDADYYKIGVFAFASAIVGSIVSLIILFLCNKNKGNSNLKIKLPQRNLFFITAKILLIQIVALFSVHLLLLLIQLIDSFFLYNKLIALDYPAQIAKELKGIYDRGQPFIQVGMVFATSIGLSSISLLTSARTLSAKQDTVRLGMRLSIGISLGSAIGLGLLIVPLNTLLFRNPDGTEFLRILMFSVFFASIIISSVHMIQVNNMTPSGFIIVIVTLLTKIILTPFLTTRYELVGTALSTSISLMTGAVFSLLILQLKYEQLLFTKREIFHLITAAAILITFIFVYRKTLPWQPYMRVSSLIEMITTSLLGGFIYIFYLFKSRFYKHEDLLLFPFGTKIQKFFPKKD